ncbi:MAG TPA: DNA polymerase III subunit gamma/tau [Flavobacteriales bacterium]|nr:DNA polymerase III subunit gamma/tau [Flavobacteriales bacterium]HMR28478.1 DNA polymerase III subunit gamma/tau [Flavobacteriales bacterium]
MSERFVVSARKYRPATFDTVVGQEAVTGTLMNAIRSGHLAQAFLFCGPRGVGKTTCARILARTINCENLNADLTTCGTCAPCRTFEEGHSLNIYELDAASNNSVDDIRNLILQVQIAPQVGSRKVYIIDEVHMLSSAAFNAFLKTLEEPPSYAIFILATTEKHKILPTILSRCQVFDFRRITVTDIVRHLAGIAEREGIEAEPQALHVIAQKADGGLRDALSIFDQLVSFAGRRLTYQDVVKNLNVLDHEHYFRVTDALVAGDVPGVLLEFDTILRNGFDGHLFVTGLGRHLRDLLVCQDPRSAGLLEVSEELAARYVEQAARVERRLLLNGLERVGQCDLNYKASKDPRLLVELLLIQLCRSAANGEAPATVPAGAEKKKPEPGGLSAAPAVASGPAPGAAQSGSPEPAAPPPAEAPAPSPHPNPTPARRLARGVSLREMAAPAGQRPGAGPTVEEPGGPVTKGPPKQVSQTLLQKAWQDFALARKREGRNSLHATLMAHEPVSAGPDLVTFVILNEVQDRYFREVGQELMAFLRHELDAPGLELKVVKEEVTDLRPRYTPMDRFRILAEKNPALLKLKDELDLDLG